MMNSSPINSNVQPSTSQREAACLRPDDQHVVMYQQWRKLLFLHWEVDAKEVKAKIPSELNVDTYNGRAYVGLVPFFMQNIRPRFLPALPGISYFLEMNVRTYVFDRYGRPGVWFFSLDANQWLAVRIARKFFALPYFDAKMKSCFDNSKSSVVYSCQRKGSEEISRFDYSGKEQVDCHDKESFEYFLVERYLLFAQRTNGKIYSGQVHHTPYPLKKAEVNSFSSVAVKQAGFDIANRKPDHAIFSDGVDVEVFPIQEVI